jgi:hypothetical protein
MKKFFIAIIITITIAVGGWLAFSYWNRGALPWNNPELVDVSIDEISLDNRGVRISGIALYKPKIYQKILTDNGSACSTAASGEEIYYIFPLIEDITSKRIKVMIRTRKPPPDDLVEKARITVEGIAFPPGKHITNDIRKKWEVKSYYIESDLVLVEEIEE